MRQSTQLEFVRLLKLGRNVTRPGTKILLGNTLQRFALNHVCTNRFCGSLDLSSNSPHRMDVGSSTMIHPTFIGN